jgi:hypothetical protein
MGPHGLISTHRILARNECSELSADQVAYPSPENAMHHFSESVFEQAFPKVNNSLLTLPCTRGLLPDVSHRLAARRFGPWLAFIRRRSTLCSPA